MAWVYMLRGSSGRYYLGSTTDLNRRLEQHRQGYVYSTHRPGQPLELAAFLEMDSLQEARATERELKRKKNPKLALLILEKRRHDGGVVGYAKNVSPGDGAPPRVDINEGDWVWRYPKK